MTKTQKELKEEFYNKFPCLVRPVAYTFTKGGKKREVEGSCEVRDSVWSWIEKALPQKRRNKMNKTELEKTFNAVLTLLVVMSITWVLALGLIIFILLEVGGII